MNRLEFMRELERLLADISESEREEALQYYNDYLNDAGVENEEEVIASLGSPQKVAETIQAGLSGSDEGAFTETGYRDYEEEKKNTVVVREQNNEESGKRSENESGQQSGQSNGQWSTQQDGQEPPHRQTAKRKMSSGTLILIIILCILFSPVILGLGAGFFATVFGILIALIALVFSLLVGAGALALGLLIAGVVLFGVGIAKLFISPLGGTLLLAGGMLCVGIGLLFLALAVWMVAKLIPAVIRFIVDIFSGLFHRKGGAKA